MIKPFFFLIVTETSLFGLEPSIRTNFSFCSGLFNAGIEPTSGNNRQIEKLFWVVGRARQFVGKPIDLLAVD